MKKALVIALSLTLAFTMAGCSSKKKETEAPQTEAKTEAAAPATEAPAVEEAVSEATAVVEEAVSEAQDVTEEAVSEAQAAVEEAVEEVSEAVESAIEDASEAVEAVAEDMSEAVEAVAEDMSEAAETVAAAEAAADELADFSFDGEYKAAVLVPGTLGDKSFWDSANEGLTALKEELGADHFDFDVQEMGEGADDQASYPDFFFDAAESGKYDVIITGSWTSVEAMNQAIEEFPDQKFILFDEEYDYSSGKGDNLYNLLFKQNEVSYLVGAEAALLSETGTICFLGGMDGKVINDFLVGYIQGAKDTNPDIKVAVSMVGNYSDSAKGKDLSLAMFNAGADVGFNVAGGAGMGILEAAKEADKLAFGVDSDQAGLNPDLAPYIPTSALKNVGAGLARSIKLDMMGQLKYGEAESLGFRQNGVELLDDEHYQEMVPEDIRAQVKELEEKISDGEIEVVTSANMTTEEIEALKASVAVK